MIATSQLPVAADTLPPRSWRGLGTREQVTLMIGADLVLWLLVSLDQLNLSILIVHAGLLLLVATLLRLMAPQQLRLFVGALLLRSLFTALGWYTAYDKDRQFYLGTNQDAYLFWHASSLPYSQAPYAFEDPLFPRLNILLNDIASAISGPHYLANTQSVVFAGALLAVFTALLLRDLYGPKVAGLTGTLMALHPSAIAYSTGLMRDSIVGMFGFAMLVFLQAMFKTPRASMKTVLLALLLGCALALAYLRSISLAGFVIAGYLLIISKTALQTQALSRKTQITIVVALSLALAFAVLDRFDRFEDMFIHSVVTRSGEGTGDGQILNPDGITTKIAETSPLLFAVIAPFALLQPMPFYAWDAPDYIGGPPALMDMVMGMGALFNQVMFGLYVVAVRYWLRRRDSFGIRVGVLFTMFVCTLSLIGLGQVRLLVAHCYPFFLVGISIAMLEVFNGDARRILHAVGIWLLALVALYLGYLAYRGLDSLELAVLPVLLCGLMLYKLWRLA